MRRVIIQIFCIYLFMFYLIAGFFAFSYPMSKYMLLSALLVFIVFVKIMMFKKTTNMFYNSMFLFLSLLVNYLLIKNFNSINRDYMSQYLYNTFPVILKSLFIFTNLIITCLALYEFLNSKTID